MQVRSRVGVGEAAGIGERLEGPRLAVAALFPTRLETRTKESNVSASHREKHSLGAQRKRRGPIPSRARGAQDRPVGGFYGLGGARALALGPERW